MSRQPFVLVAKGKTMKTPKSPSTMWIFGPMSHTDAIILSQKWQDAGHWVSVRFPDPEVPVPPPLWATFEGPEATTEGQ